MIWLLHWREESPSSVSTRSHPLPLKEPQARCAAYVTCFLFGINIPPTGAAEHKLLRNCGKLFSVALFCGHRESMLLQIRSKMVSVTYICQLARGYPVKSSKFSPPTLLQLVHMISGICRVVWP
jgi:hypothetical protein